MVVVIVVKRGFHLAHEAMVFAIEDAFVDSDFLTAFDDAFANGADDAGGMVEEAVGEFCTKMVWFEGHTWKYQALDLFIEYRAWDMTRSVFVYYSPQPPQAGPKRR